MRLFVAVVPPPAAIQELTGVVAALRGLPQGRALRWTGEPTWHVTLAFLGQVEAEAVSGLEARLAAVAEGRPAPELRLAGGGCFGDRALWAGLRGDTGPLRALAEAVTDAARSTGVDLDDRPFRPHLTLARTAGRSTAGGLGPLAAALTDFSGSSWTATPLRLIRSHLGAGPPHYETVGEWTLDG
ncbi:RNA 2',3'-cyclic phosphodiesterase [Streptacidiphilus sp. EB129]|uniref:RNA 2',3'-cyclic phosphodiesterase n=1 Tax=Streptacidiphilus sp. EB129 TaxID=3156262 RepID=UPI003514ED0E